MNSYSGWSAGSVDRPQSAGNTGIAPGSCNTLSILYDAYGAGINFTNTVWSSEINTSGTNQLRVSDIGPVTLANNLDGTAATAQAIVMYFLSKNTIMMSAAGIDMQR